MHAPYFSDLPHSAVIVCSNCLPGISTKNGCLSANSVSFPLELLTQKDSASVFAHSQKCAWPTAVCMLLARCLKKSTRGSCPIPLRIWRSCQGLATRQPAWSSALLLGMVCLDSSCSLRTVVLLLWKLHLVHAGISNQQPFDWICQKKCQKLWDMCAGSSRSNGSIRLQMMTLCVIVWHQLSLQGCTCSVQRI